MHNNVETSQSSITITRIGRCRDVEPSNSLFILLKRGAINCDHDMWCSVLQELLMQRPAAAAIAARYDTDMIYDIRRVRKDDGIFLPTIGILTRPISRNTSENLKLSDH